MRRAILLLTFVMFAFGVAPGQSKYEPATMQLYIVGGIKTLHPKNFGHDENVSPAFVPTIGGGVLWQVKKFQIGGEFNYADGKKHSHEFGTIFTGINFNLIGGYHWRLGPKVGIGVQSGIGYSLHHLSVTDKNYTSPANLNTAIYHNVVYTVPVSIWLQRINANGTMMGVRAGYHVNVMPNEWRYMEGTSTEVYNTTSDGFYVQVVIGGWLNLKRTRP